MFESVDSQELINDENRYLLISRPMPMPLASKNCIIRVYCSKVYDEMLYMIASSSDSKKILCNYIYIYCMHFIYYIDL